MASWPPPEQLQFSHQLITPSLGSYQGLRLFYGALSNVEYNVTVIDTATGTVKTDFKPSGIFANVADAAAFLGWLREIAEPSLALRPAVRV